MNDVIALALIAVLAAAGVAFVAVMAWLAHRITRALQAWTDRLDEHRPPRA